MAPAAVEQFGEAGVGAGMLGAGDRVAGNEMHARPEHAASTCAITAALTEPTSVTIAPGLRRGAIAFGDLAVGADRHGEDDEIGVLAPPRPASLVSQSPKPSSSARVMLLRVRRL